MTEKDILITQTLDTYQWTNTFLNSIPFEKWDITPGILETNVTWQAGHLIMSNYYHSIMVVAGHQMDVLKMVPLKEYNAFFTDGSPMVCVGKTKPEELLEYLKIVQEKSIHILENLSPDDLDHALEPTPIPHPIAKIKREALDWNIKHTMYHCGQIGLLKRVIHERYDFGLRKE
ncbi:DinB family protein [Pollutibacter soli]|uniref:DinB family protein n=1 Tax=Pollutibacter soli TaxID=3034157 RepID=UPI00301356D3